MIGGTVSNRTKLIAVACMALFMVFYVWWSSGYVTKQSKADRDHFNAADIHGIFVKRDIRHHTVAFQVDNLPDWFVFWPKTRVGFSSDDFEYFVRLGDSIIKVRMQILYISNVAATLITIHSKSKRMIRHERNMAADRDARTYFEL